MPRVLFAAFWAFLAVAGAAFAVEAPAIQWTRTFGGDGYDMGTAVRQTSDGGYILAGATMSFGDENFDAYVIKTDPLGNLEWSRTYGGYNTDEATSVLEVDGGYIIAGTTASIGPQNHNMYLIRTEVEGNEVWSHAYGGDEYDHASAVEPTVDGGYILAGFTESFGVPGRNMYVVKVDAAGDEVWSAAFGEETEDSARTVLETRDGGCIVGGYSSSPQSQKPRLYIVKTDGRGNEVWSRIYEEYGEAISIRERPAGGFVVNGTSDWGMSAFVLEIDDRGEEVSSRQFKGFDQVHAVQDLEDGGAMILASIYIHERDGSVCYLWRLDAPGSILWSLELAGCAFQRTTDGGWIVVNGCNDLSLIKVGPENSAFQRGKVNGDDRLDIADVISLLDYLFLGTADGGSEAVLACLDAADANDDGLVDISDPIAMLVSQYLTGLPLPEPTLACGLDETPDVLGCASAPNCP